MSGSFFGADREKFLRIFRLFTKAFFIELEKKKSSINEQYRNLSLKDLENVKADSYIKYLFVNFSNMPNDLKSHFTILDSRLNYALNHIDLDIKNLSERREFTNRSISEEKKIGIVLYRFITSGITWHSLDIEKNNLGRRIQYILPFMFCYFLFLRFSQNDKKISAKLLLEVLYSCEEGHINKNMLGLFFTTLSNKN